MTTETLATPEARSVPERPRAVGDDRVIVDELLTAWSEEADALLDRGRVVDRLLDLRNLLAGPDRLAVDLALVDVPGRNLVERDWWLRRVCEMRWFLGFVAERPPWLRDRLIDHEPSLGSSM